MKTIEIKSIKEYRKAVRKLQRGYKVEAHEDVLGYVYKDGKCVGQVIMIA